MIEKSRSAIHVAGSEPASSELTTELHGGTRFPTGLFRPSLGVLFQLVFMISVADVTSVEFAGGNVRLAWIALPLLMLMLPAGGGERFFALATFALFLVHIISALASGAILKGLVYSGWIIVNYICFFRPAIILTRRMGSRVWGAIIWGGRFQCAIAVLLVFAGLHERARFIYFEPSYFAIGLVPYIFSVIFIAEKKALDLALLALTFSFSLSANMMIALSMAAACWLIYERRFVSTLFLVVLVCGAIFAVYRHALVNEMDANHNLAAWISENGFSVEFLDTLFRRAGNRLPRIEAAIEISRENWWFGVGPGIIEI